MAHTGHSNFTAWLPEWHRTTLMPNHNEYFYKGLNLNSIRWREYTIIVLYPVENQFQEPMVGFCLIAGTSQPRLITWQEGEKDPAPLLRQQNENMVPVWLSTRVGRWKQRGHCTIIYTHGWISVHVNVSTCVRHNLSISIFNLIIAITSPLSYLLRLSSTDILVLDGSGAWSPSIGIFYFTILCSTLWTKRNAKQEEGGRGQTLCSPSSAGTAKASKKCCSSSSLKTAPKCSSATLNCDRVRNPVLGWGSKCANCNRKFPALGMMPAQRMLY